MEVQILSCAPAEKTPNRGFFIDKPSLACYIVQVMTPATNAANTVFYQQIGNFGWLALKLLLGVVLAVLVIGLIIGPFTYGKPRRKPRRNENFLDSVVYIGIELSHRLIDLLRGRLSKSSGRGGWLNDQQLLAMLRGMKPSEFEEYIAQVFAHLGYNTMLVGGSGDGGIDIEMTKDGRHYVVQCKKFITRKVDPHDVRDFYGAMGDRRIDGKGFFITTNIFTFEAEQFAEGKQMELIDGNRLIDLVRKSGVMGNSTGAPTNEPQRCPDCGKELVVRTNSNDGTKFLGCTGYPGCRYTKTM